MWVHTCALVHHIRDICTPPCEKTHCANSHSPQKGNFHLNTQPTTMQPTTAIIQPPSASRSLKNDHLRSACHFSGRSRRCANMSAGYPYILCWHKLKFYPTRNCRVCVRRQNAHMRIRLNRNADSETRLCLKSSTLNEPVDCGLWKQAQTLIM